MKKILVTGGAGYIGSHTCVELLNEGRQIVVVDNFSNSKMESLVRVKKITGQDFPVFAADVSDKNAMEKIFDEHEIGSVIHFAGFKAVGESVRIPLEYYRNNIDATLVLCSVMQSHNVKRLVFSSSATVYGDPKTVPITEDFPLWCTNPYGWTKLMIEQILGDLYKSDPEWSIILLRYFNPVGAHESGMIGEDPNGIPNNLMPYISQVAVGKRERLQVFGNDYPTPDGTGVRDYIHVVDLAKGHTKAILRAEQTFGADPVNLGTGVGYSVLQMVAAFEKASGRMIPYEFTGRRPGDIAVCYADTSKAKKLLGWEAKKTLEEMCLDNWRWQQQNPNGYSE
jgi:UDP-glucose 4-epimerase